MSKAAKKPTRHDLIIEVTEKRIKRGIKESPGRCPIALAIRGHRFTNVHVETHTVTVKRGKTYFNGSLPVRAQRFIDAFDNGRLVRPFAFRLRLEPDEDILKQI